LCFRPEQWLARSICFSLITVARSLFRVLSGSMARSVIVFLSSTLGSLSTPVSMSIFLARSGFMVLSYSIARSLPWCLCRVLWLAQA
jgi:hypothetical protein